MSLPRPPRTSGNGNASNGDASQPGLEVGSVGDMRRTLSKEELSNAFGHVPWMEFNVTARPNIKAFSSHPAIRQVISQVAHGTLNDIKDAITTNVMNSINDIVEKAVKDATGDVPKHVMNNMTKTFDGLSLAPTVTPNTDFQRLQSAGIINNYDIDNSVNNIGNTNNVNSGNTNIDSGNTNLGNNNNNPIFPPTPGPNPGPNPGPTPGPGPVIPDPDPTPVASVAKPDIAKAKWIWTNEQPYGQPPGGPRAFRKLVPIPLGQSVDSMIIDITCDNWYTLYVNGYVVGNGTAWNKVQRYSIKFPKTNRVLVAVYASNDPVLLQQAGLIASAVMWDSTNYTGRTFDIGTDSSWKTSITTSASGFERPSYRPDSSWTSAREEGPYGMAPWGAVAKPTTTDPVTGGFSGLTIPDPPPAQQATPGPDSDGNTNL
ncbi:hypothetical protein D9619_007474 [Psilocybe cf. subviscida]|uniref:Uncharacterized protein n=1 Tax=Psilocybe cf. subviscida TaxID=2480587 RepID=A0A8H5B1J6_9AGAR|nr:hypothetical protein D9619_007474 [Psilocybe cf. subviscida]